MTQRFVVRLSMTTSFSANFCQRSHERYRTMTPYKKRLNPFIQRMAEDMQLRNLADSTIDAYTYHVDKFCQFFGKSADQLGPEEIREYQLYLVNEKKVSWSSFNQAVCGLRFLYVSVHQHRSRRRC